MLRGTHESFQRNVSNPAQNFSVSTCQDSLFRDAKCLKLVDVSGRLPVTRKSQGRFDGTRTSPLAQLGPPTARLRGELVREGANDTDTPGPGSPLAKNVSVLRVDNATQQDVLPGVRQVSQSGLACQSAHALRAGWSSVNRSLDHRRVGMCSSFWKARGCTV